MGLPTLPDGYKTIESEKNLNSYFAYFEATGEFTLYLKKEGPGETNMYISPAGGLMPAPVHLPPNFLYNQVVMADFGGLVFPKRVTLVSSVPFLLAYKCNS